MHTNFISRIIFLVIKMSNIIMNQSQNFAIFNRKKLSQGCWIITSEFFIKVMTMRGHSNEIKTIAVSQDSTKVFSGSRDGLIKIWEVETGYCIRTLNGHGSEVESIALSRDSSIIVSGGRDCTVRKWIVDTGEPIGVIEGPPEGYVTSVALNFDSSIIISGQDQGIIKVWDFETNELLFDLIGHLDYISSITINEESTRIFSGSHDGTIRVWDMASAVYLSRFKVDEKDFCQITSFALSKDAAIIVSCYSDGQLRIWDVAMSICIQTLCVKQGVPFSVAINEDSSRIVVSFQDRKIRIYNLNKDNNYSFKLIRMIEEHKRISQSVAISKMMTVSGSLDYTIKIWNPPYDQQQIIR